MLYVKQEKPVTTKHEKLGDISFEVEVPQPQDLEELKVACGGEANLVEFACGQIATNAKNVARAYARGFEVPKDVTLTPEKIAEFVAQIAKRGQELAHDYSPAAEGAGGPSKAKKAAAYDQIAALVESGQEFTKEQLFSLLQQAK
ncbi:MAG TPA: hypothetical protein VF944_09395 [Candidatus Bathyarchaeia archaeon]